MSCARGFIPLGLILALIIGLALLSGYYVLKRSNQSPQGVMATSTTATASSVGATKGSEGSATLTPSQQTVQPVFKWMPLPQVPQADRRNLEYSKNGNTILWAGRAITTKSWPTKTVAVDSATFVVAVAETGDSAPDYAKDKNHVYWEGQLISQAYPDSFTVLSEDNPDPTTADVCGFWATDRNHIYNGAGADGYVTNPDGTDGTPYPDVYYADPATFSLIWSGNVCYPFEKDRHAIYAGEDKIPNADVLTFAPIYGPHGSIYAKDASHVYMSSAAIDGADVPSFTALLDKQGYETLYSKDKNHVYLRNQSPGITVIDGADPNTFTVTENASSCYDGPNGVACTFDAQDKNHKYLQGQLVQ